MTRYRTIVADPPWRYDLVGATKADLRKFYDTMSVGEICGLRDVVLPFAETDAHLWLWGTNAMLEEAYDVEVLAALANGGNKDRE